MPTDGRADLSAVVKAYDVRGVVPDEWGPREATALGAACADVLGVAGRPFVIGHDMRPSSGALVDAFADGVTARGGEVVLIGLASTDGLYYASGVLDCPGAMFTASHNPARYNGIKVCRPGARAVGQDTGLAAVRERAERYLADGVPEAEHRGAREERDLLRGYAEHLRGLVDVSAGRRLKVVVDAGNGMAGHTVPAVLGRAAGLDPLPIELVPLYFELDGSFPNHEANPLEPENLRDLQAAVIEHGADVGLAFDGDADRCFVVDELGGPVSPSAVTAMVAVREVAKELAAGRRAGGDPQPHHVARGAGDGDRGGRHAVAHPRRPLVHQGRDGFQRSRLRRRALRPLLLPRVLGRRHRHARGAARAGGDAGVGRPDLAAGGRVRALRRQRRDQLPRRGRAVRGGSRPRCVRRPRHLRRPRRPHRHRSRPGGRRTGPVWWFNLRGSNTEPLLRLNVEAVDVATMGSVRDEVLALVRQET